MAKESFRITPFEPKALTKEEKADIQAGMLITHKVNVSDSNAAGLARYEANKNGGAWDYENYVENFGEDEKEMA